MGDLRREFVEKHKKYIICEPSSRTYSELLGDKVQVFRLMTEIPREKLRKKKKSSGGG